MSLDPFAWADRSVSVMASLVRGVGAPDVLACWGRAYSAPVRCVYADLEELGAENEDSAERARIAVRNGGQDLGGVVEVWEPMGQEGMRPEVLTAVSRTGAEILSLNAAEGAGSSFAYAADGLVMASASSLAPGELGTRRAGRR